MMLYRTNENPIICAWSIDDKRLGVCILGIARGLTTVVDHNYFEGKDKPGNYDILRWIGKTQDNFMWAASYAYGLLTVYKQVYNKRHSCHDEVIRAMCLQKTLPKGPLTEFPTSIEFNRHVLNLKWNHSSTWKNRVPPAWREHIVRH